MDLTNSVHPNKQNRSVFSVLGTVPVRRGSMKTDPPWTSNYEVTDLDPLASQRGRTPDGVHTTGASEFRTGEK